MVCCAAAATVVLCRVVSFAIAEQRLRRALHFGGCRSGPGDNSADAFLELARDPVHGRFPFRHGASRRLLALCAETFGVDQPILEDGQAARDMADLVTMLDERDLNAQVALCQTVHDAAYRTERTNQAATESERGQSRDEQPGQTARGDPDGAVEHHRVDIVGIDACLDCEQLLALTIPAGIGELRQLGTTRRFRHLVFEEAAAGAGFANDILNQQLALIVFVVPAIDIDVFRVGMHIGDAGIGAAGAVDAEIVSGFAPAHGADRIESKLPGFLRRDLAGFGFFLVIRQDLLRGLDQIEHLGPAFLDDGIAKDHHLSG